MDMIMDVSGLCDHEPPHRIDQNTNTTGGDYPEVPCGGKVEEWEIKGECLCGEIIDGIFTPIEYPYLPEHECPSEE